MPLREELILKKPNDGEVLEIQQIGQDIVDGIFAGDDVSDKIGMIAKMTGRNHYDFDYFETLHSHSSIEEFANSAAQPVPPRVPDITRDELIEIVRLAMNFKDPDGSDYYRGLFDRNVPMADASGLMDYPENWVPGQDLSEYDPSPEEIVDRALSPDNVIHL